MQKEQKIVGWREWVALPDLDIPAIKAKIDSGARTSALHTFELNRVKENGKDLVEFRLHPLRKHSDIVIKCKSEIIDVRSVKDSGGHKEERFIINTKVALKDLIWDIELSLTNREDMLFRMLLGRTALVGANLFVDPAQSYCNGKELAKSYSDYNLCEEQK